MTKRIWVLTLCLLLTFSGLTACGKSGEPGAESTLDNIFTTPTTEAASAPTAATTVPHVSSGEITIGNLSHGIGGEKLTDETGTYRLYEGGEIHLPYNISAPGLQQYGVGILLFVDGHPQPYKTTFSDTYAYMHTFDLDFKGNAADELIFTPVVGEAGDMLEIYTLNINYPDYFPGETDFGFAHTNGSVAAGTRLLYEETPGTAVSPEEGTQASFFTKESIDLTSSEIYGWSAEKLQSEVEWNFTLKGQEYGTLEIGSLEEVEACFEIFGNPLMDFGLVVYWNNEPVWMDGSPMTEIHTENGKKTVVNLRIPAKSLEADGALYAVLVPRNYRTSEAGASCFIQPTATFYISRN